MSAPTAQEALRMAWWNGMTHRERRELQAQAAAILGDFASIAQCWELWQARRITMHPMVKPEGTR